MKYGCIGEKLGHSFSAEIHAELFDYDYQLREVARDELHLFMTQKDFAAINVTIPYTEAVIPYLDAIDDAAREIGAVNTIVNENGKLTGYNTDFMGLRALIERMGLDLKDKKVLIAGSGGTSRTAAAVAHALGAAEVHRMSRKPSEGLISYEQAKAEHADAQILINTTPLGMYPNLGSTAVELDDYPKLEGVVDAVYNPLRSALVEKALQKGITAEGGLYMLVAQAARAAEKFVGTSVPEEKIDRIYNKLFCSKENIVLIGMPGSGKSTVGKVLAKKLGRPFEDTDAWITERYGDIPAIFEKHGEAHFRDLESEAVKALSAQSGRVIATGGGAVLRAENLAFLRQNGKIYFLDRPLEDIMPTDDRPLSRDRAALEARYRERLPLYLAGGKRIDCACSVADIVQEIGKDFLL